MTTHLLPAAVPFDFEQSLRFLSGFSPMTGEQLAVPGLFVKALRVDGADLLASLRAKGTGVEVTLEGKATTAQRAAALARLSRMFSLEDDLQPFYALARKDPVMVPVLEQLHGLHQVCFPSPFEAAVWFILSQRCPMAVARAMKGRLTERFGGVVGPQHRSFPEASDVVAASPQALQEALRHPVKAARVASAARAFAAVDLRFLQEGDFTQVRDWLLEIDGVGPWSAAAVLLRGLGRTDSLAGAEGQLLEHVRPLYGALDTGQFQRLAARYGRHQGLWSYYVRSASVPSPRRRAG
jgi:DNA-3-methyladenine glycosylase II